MNLVLYAVQSGHHHRRECKIRICRRIWETHLNAASLRNVNERDAYCRRAVTSRVSKVDRSFKARHESLVGVGPGIGNCVQCLGVLNDAADVVDGELRQSTIAVTGEEILFSFPD